MKTRFNLLAYVLVACIAIGSVSCEGDQGEIGPKGDKGDTGTTGTTGATGANGTDGDDGAGFEELTQYGHVELTMSGKRIDDVTFKQITDFTYMPKEGVSYNSSFYKSGDESYFYISRENKGKVTSTINGRTQDSDVDKNRIWINVSKNADGFTITNLEIDADVVSPDFKTFEFNYYDGTDNTDFDVTISNESYDPATGKLIFNFNYTIPGANNTTGSDVVLTGKVDVIVFESINPL